jgi:hypothetical protein
VPIVCLKNSAAAGMRLVGDRRLTLAAKKSTLNLPPDQAIDRNFF